MKRSEMLKAIVHYVKYTSHLDMSVHGDSNYEQLAKELLQLIENKGMLPPETKATPEDFSNLDLRQDFLDKHDFTVNRWDAEDDLP